MMMKLNNIWRTLYLFAVAAQASSNTTTSALTYGNAVEPVSTSTFSSSSSSSSKLIDGIQMKAIAHTYTAVPTGTVTQTLGTSSTSHVESSSSGTVFVVTETLEGTITSYTTTCPLSGLKTSSTSVSSSTTRPSTTTTASSSISVTVITDTISGVVTSYTTTCPLSGHTTSTTSAGVTVVTDTISGVVTSYTTTCPLSGRTSSLSSTISPITTSSLVSTTGSSSMLILTSTAYISEYSTDYVTITSCVNNACSTLTSKSTITHVRTSYTTYCPLSDSSKFSSSLEAHGSTMWNHTTSATTTSAYTTGTVSQTSTSSVNAHASTSAPTSSAGIDSTTTATTTTTSVIKKSSAAAITTSVNNESPVSNGGDVSVFTSNGEVYIISYTTSLIQGTNYIQTTKTLSNTDNVPTYLPPTVASSVTTTSSATYSSSYSHSSTLDATASFAVFNSSSSSNATIQYFGGGSQISMRYEILGLVFIGIAFFSM
ncbi:hypothetical protein DASC09_056760 [Saccharomycopsis crataegensis]|uniref:Uncharacterized protein n=1 Tax=Saccharomycopsis crataegensis TaxID=43959 RepID=A0AAV5QTV7_9ASCO|nr:hypothetical protein DASC09_056760 [Saccharomycopsis crataegensis]